MKKFTINCDFNGQMAPFAIYIGQPEPGHHPLHFQADWLSKQRGGTIPAEVMDAIDKLKALAEQNNVPLEELCVYAIGSAQEEEMATAEGAQEEASGEDTPYDEIQGDYSAADHLTDSFSEVSLDPEETVISTDDTVAVKPPSKRRKKASDAS